MALADIAGTTIAPPDALPANFMPPASWSPDLLPPAPPSSANPAPAPAPPGAVAQTPVLAAAESLLTALLEERWTREAMPALLGDHALGDLPDIIAAAAHAARALGERWVADTCSFADVTLGLHRLTLMLIDIEEAAPPPLLHGGHVLLAAAPGDQHGFGLATVALALRQAGWDVAVDLSGDPDALIAAARGGVDCIGLAVGHDRAVAATAALIRRLRAACRRGTLIAAGGPMLACEPALATIVGADLAVADGFALAAALHDRRLSHAA